MTIDEFIKLQALSPSGAKKILRAPAIYRWEKDNPPPSSDNLDFGKVVHGLTFGHGDPVEVIHADSWRGKAAQEAKAEALAAGRIPILPAAYDKAEAIVAAIKANPLAASLLKEGEPEQPWVWTDEATGVTCKARTDWTTRIGGELVIVDLKTAASADPGEFRRSVATYRYHVQEAMCRAGVTAATGEPTGFLFIVIEKEPPYLVSVVELDDEAKARGEELAARAAAIYAECLRTGEWPGYPQTVNRISLPAWAFYDNDDEDMVV